jgi:aldehyde:ferredoxin oxidoreductase
LTAQSADILRVDLKKERTERVTLDEGTLRSYVGGTGLGAKFLYDETPPGAAWSDPENRLIFAAGPLNATPMGGSGSIAVVSKGPLTNGAGCSQANGWFGAYLKLCGLHAIIVHGASEKLKYLHIESESAELKDAEWLKGMDTYRTADLLKHELGCRPQAMSVASVGPAGENRVKYAGIFIDHGHSASHNGLGAVMGAKKLKAIAVSRGKKQVSIDNPEKLTAIANKLVEIVKTQTKDAYDYGTLKVYHRNAKLNMLPVKNYTTSKWSPDEDHSQQFDAANIRKKYAIRRESCWACQLNHCFAMQITEGPYQGETLEEPEYEQLAAWSSGIGQEEVTNAMMLGKEVDRLGFENNEAEWVIGFAMECYEKGILTKEKTNGLDLSWGNTESAKLLLNLIANRQGIGDKLGEGVMRAAKEMGGEAPSMAVHTMKGNTPRSHDHRNRVTEQFDTCISNTGTLETWGGPIALGSFPKWEDMVESNLHDKGALMFEDSLVLCRFNSRTNVDLLSQAVSAVTGWAFSWEEAYTMGKRAVHLLRAFNVKHGVSGRSLDRPSIRYGSLPDVGEGQGKSLVNVWDQMLDKYYAGMGWDNDGRPLPETLEKFGLTHIAKDLWK